MTHSAIAPNAELIVHFVRAKLLPLLSTLAEDIDWDAAPNQLQAGDLSVLDEDVAREIRDLADRAEFVELAQHLQVEPVVLVVGLIAQVQSSRNRTAARIAKAVVGDRSVETI